MSERLHKLNISKTDLITTFPITQTYIVKTKAIFKLEKKMHYLNSVISGINQ